MGVIKSYTDIEQSKKLAEILPIESSDMYYDGYGRFPKVYAYALISINSFKCNVPCWSLAALLDEFFIPLLTKELDGWYLSCLTIKDHKPMVVEGCADPIEACYKMLIKLYEMKML